jgi:hypothetical protein
MLTLWNEYCIAWESLLPRLPIPSNMFPKLSVPEPPKLISSSNNLGGVAVLAVLAVIALSLRPGVYAADCVMTGNCGGGDTGSTRTSFFDLLANENVLPAFLIDHPLERGVGGTGMSWSGRGLDNVEFVCESLEISVVEGMVEEELSRAEDAALP